MKSAIEIDLTVPTENIVEQVNDLISYIKSENLLPQNTISDGYHTFDELYEIRKAYNVALFTLMYRLGIGEVHKSKRHNDGEECFGGGWFIVNGFINEKQISNHYPLEDWDLFKIPEHIIALYPFDGHTTTDVIERLKNI